MFMDGEELNALMDRVREISDRSENRQRGLLWEPEAADAKDHWRGSPLRFDKLYAAPFTVEPEFPLWSKIIGFDTVAFYSDPDCYLKNTLKIAIYRYEHFQDCTPISKTISIWLGVPFESSLFGAHTILRPGESPWLDREPVILDEKSLADLKMPDFYRSGLMPVAHRFYERLGELLDDDFAVTFPEWGRGPWGVASHLRLLHNIAMDIMDNPAFVHRIMRFITDARKQWWLERARFLRMPLEAANLYNDEVNCPTLSPHMYQEFVLPYEQELSAFHGGIGYWHSCGDTTKLLALIDSIPQLRMFHVGPWTDLRRVIEVFGERHPLEICLNPVVDVQTVSPEQMVGKLQYIMRVCGDMAYTVRADGIQDLNGTPGEVAQLQKWVAVARQLMLHKGADTSSAFS